MMVRYLILVALLFSSTCSLQAQKLKETIRGKYGEYQGTAETRMRGGKAVTVYKVKYGQVTGKGSVKGRMPSKSSTYTYGYSKGKGK